MEQITYYKDKYQTVINKWVCDIRDNVKDLEDFEKYVNQNEDQYWMKNEGLPRLLQSVVNFTPKQIKNIQLFNLYMIFGEITENFKISEKEIFYRIMNICNSFIENEKQWQGQSWTKHRNVCLSFMIVLNLCKPKIEQQTIDQMFDYLIRIIHKPQHMETVLWAVLVLEKLHAYKQFSIDKINQMVQELKKLYQPTITSSVGCDEFDSFSYQVEFCAKWFIGQLSLSQDENVPSVKIQNEGVSVRNDELFVPFIRSSFKITSKVYFYEVYLQADSLVKIGWATEECDVEMLRNSKNSIFLDIRQKLISHGADEYEIDSRISFEPGVTVGFLIDFPSKKFEFYLDGVKLDFSGNVNFSSDPYYASALLFAHQHIYFNFGQIPFKYPPKNYSKEFRDFHTGSLRNVNNYRLIVYDIMDKYCLGNDDDEVVKNKKQAKIDKLIRNIEDNVLFKWQSQWILKDDFTDLIADQQDFICLIKSIIKYVGVQIKDKKIDILIGYIMQYLSMSNPPPPHWKDVLEIISPIMKLNPIAFKNKQKQLNVCIVLMIVFQLYSNKNEAFLYEEVKDFLCKTFTNESGNSWTMLFVLKCFEYNIANISNKASEIIEKLCRLANYIESHGDYSNLSNVDLIHYQVSFCAKNIVDSFPIFSLISQIQTRNLSIAHETTSKLQILADQLSVRSDNNWQSIKFDFFATDGVYFYEVTMLTSGSMRFGWAPVETEFSGINCVGDDKYSVGFDGYRRYIRQNNAVYKIDYDYRWHAGSVVGCVVDVHNQTFLWYLNGKPVDCKKGLFGIKHKWNFSSSLYQPTASLSPLQQCVFNFGQFPFRYPPFILNYSCFESTKIKFLDEIENQINFNDDTQELFDKLAISILTNLLTADLINIRYTDCSNWFGVEEMFRVTFSIIKVIDKNFFNFYQIYQFFNKITSNETDKFTKNLLKTIYSLRENKLLTSLYKQIICMIFVFVLEKANDSIKNETCNKVFVLLMDIRQLSQDCLETVFWATIALEKLFKCKTIQQNFKTDIVKLTSNLTEEFETLEMLSIYDICQNPDQYRNTFCAKWLRDYLSTQNDITSMPPVKLSVDRLTARNDAWLFPSVMSVFPIDSGVYYYEAVLVSEGIMQIGWSTKESHFNETDGAGDDKHSIGFDGLRNCIWHEGQIEIKKHYQWKSGDVVGCLIDANNKEFRFYLNGKLIDDYEVEVYFSSKPYYAAASFSSHQQCVFNFGSEPFKHPPNDIKYRNIHFECHGNMCLYQLQAPTLINDRFIFEDIGAYNDDKQTKLDRLLSFDIFEENNFRKLIKKYIRFINDNSETTLRLCQAIINFSGKIIPTKYRIIINIFNQLIVKLPTKTFESIMKLKLFFILNVTKMESNSKIHKNIIVLLNILCEISNRKGFNIQNLIPFEKSLNYLAEIIEKLGDIETTLSAMLLIEKLVFTSNNSEFSNLLIHLSNKLKILSAEMKIENVYKSNFHLTQCQVALLAQFYLDHYLTSKRETASKIDQFSVRNYRKKTISVTSAFEINSGVFFYEVVILTKGSIRVGWSTWNNTETIDQNDGKLGNDELSIAFDTFDKCIWHNNHQYKLPYYFEGHVGDVIGCLIDMDNSNFIFYFNGHKIDCSEIRFISNDPEQFELKLLQFCKSPYFASATLSTQQQCYFNLGQTSFKNLPRDFNCSNIYSSSTKIKKNLN